MALDAANEGLDFIDISQIVHISAIFQGNRGY